MSLTQKTMQQFYSLDEFWEFDRKRHGPGRRVVDIVEQCLPVAEIKLNWSLPFVRVAGRAGRVKSLLYLAYKSPREMNKNYLRPFVNPGTDPELYLGFMNGAKLHDFGNLFERTDHKMVRYYWVNEIEAFNREPFRLLLAEAYETLFGYPPQLPD